MKWNDYLYDLQNGEPFSKKLQLYSTNWSRWNHQQCRLSHTENHCSLLKSWETSQTFFKVITANISWRQLKWKPFKKGESITLKTSVSDKYISWEYFVKQKWSYVTVISNDYVKPSHGYTESISSIQHRSGYILFWWLNFFTCIENNCM